MFLQEMIDLKLLNVGTEAGVGVAANQGDMSHLETVKAAVRGPRPVASGISPSGRRGQGGERKTAISSEWSVRLSTGHNNSDTLGYPDKSEDSWS